MLIPDYTTIDTAKLLKKAGFPQEFKLSYGNTLIATDDGPLCRPHLWDTIKWLREEKNIEIEINVNVFKERRAIIVKGHRENRIFRQYVCTFKSIESGFTLSEARMNYEESLDKCIATACKYLTHDGINP